MDSEPELLIGVLGADTEFVAGAEGPNQVRRVLPAGTEVAVDPDSVGAVSGFVTAYRLRPDGTAGRASARLPLSRIHVP